MSAANTAATQALQALRRRGLLRPGLLVQCADGGLEVEASYSAGGRAMIAALETGALVDDPASSGALLAALREAWGDPGMFVHPRFGRDGWAVRAGMNLDAATPLATGDTELLATIAALLAAPEAT